MTLRSAPIPDRRRRRRRWLAYLAASILIVLATIYIAFGRLDPTSGFAPGEPRTLEELDAWYPEVPDEQNAAIPLLKLIESGKLGPLNDARDRITASKYQNDLSEDDRIRLRIRLCEEVIGNSADSLDELHTLLQLPSAHFDVDFNDFSVQLLTELVDTAQGLTVLARFHAERSEVEQSFRCLEDTYRLSEILADTPSWLPFSAGNHIRLLAITAARDVASKPALTMQQLDQLNHIVSRLNRPDQFYRALAGSRYETIVATNKWLKTTFNPLQNAVYVAYMNRLVDASQGPLSELAKTTQDVRTELDETNRRRFEIRKRFADRGLLRAREAAWTAEMYVQTQISDQALVQGIAVLRYRATIGKYPATLEELVPQYLPSLPEDPYGNGPYRYQATDDSFRIYSLGRNRVDDHGDLRTVELKRMKPPDSGLDFPIPK